LNIEEQFNFLEKSSAVGVFIYQEKGKIVYANDAFSKLVGYSKEELLGENILDFVSADKEYIAEQREIIKKRTSGELFSYEDKIHQYKAKNGSIIPTSVFAYTINYNNKPSGILIVIDKTKEESFKRLYFALSQINQLIVRENREEPLLTSICEILVHKAGYGSASIVTIDETTKLCNIKYISAKKEIYKDILTRVTVGVDKSKPYGRGSISEAYHTKKVALISKVMENEKVSYWTDEYKALNTHSVCSIPIMKQNKVEYIILILDDMSNSFDYEHIHLLEEIQSDIEFALEKIEKDKYSRITLAALNTGFDFVIITDSNFNIVYVNKSALRITGYTKNELIGKHHSIFSSKTHNKEFIKQFYDKLTKEKTFSSIMTYKIKNSSLVNVKVTIVPFKIDGKIKYYIAVGEDLTEKQELYTQLETLMNYDSLTGLTNRTSFINSIEHFMKRAGIKNIIGAVAVINPINFKNINHAFGFETGNLLLKKIAHRLKKNLRRYDVISKLEADKFGILIKELKNKIDITVVVTNMFNTLKELYDIDKNKISLSFNIGVSLYPEDGLSALELLDKANAALVDAQKKGENSVGFFEKGIEETVSRKLRLKTDLSLALLNREFIVYYQPYVDKNNRIVGAEALLRWKKDGKIIQPLEFIPLLEQTDLIIDVEQHVLNTIVKEINKIKKLDITPVHISINLSQKSFRQPDLEEIILSEINQLNVERNLLNIEVTERVLIGNFEHINNLIQSLQKQHITFALDDFGTGYSSLAYLSQFPIDYLKIDISFVRQIIDNAKTRSITESTIDLAKKLNIKTIAEGVETAKQFNLLKSFGCDYFQGYLFSKPLPEEEFERLLTMGTIEFKKKGTGSKIS